MATSVREPIQVYLPAAQVEALNALAQARGVTRDELIEQSVDTLLTGAPDVIDEEAGAAGWPANCAIEDDPLWAIVGIGASDVTDLAENHDKYLREAAEANNHPWPKKPL